ncbi:MAG: GNAT family N-acetyltransferase [Meiothermus ruber]|uniref:GNAT family N-acetyltransferase n=1 Tax=Meiothermus ruber TaxID=277 RepID=UPI0023F62A1A|nr:GNAT family N-acetyltransferase [Meiothermus ruber]MCL6529829.1 GNAT family N-acetyltransferase [Meiothermus ruber]
MNEILASPDQRFVVVQSEPWMAEQLEVIQRLSFPSLAEDELTLAHHFRSHMQHFPQGQHAVIERESGRVVASSSDLIVRLDLSHIHHRFVEISGQMTLSTHDPQGDWLYGADIGVHPDYRGQGLSTLLYTARQGLVRRLGLKGHSAGAMPKGYGAVQQEMPLERYLLEVIRGERFDPVISVQLKRGYAIWGIIPEYLEDPSCANYGVLILWRNPDRAKDGWL